jgi:biopolymer transport protein ExbD
MARSPHRKRSRDTAASELELMPMLNVFIAIIPLLLLSAAFVPVAVIKTTLPAAAGGAVEAPKDTPLELSIHIRKDAYVVAIEGGPMRVIQRAGVAPAAAQAELASALAEVAAAYVGKREVQIVSRSTTRYEEIIEVMDVSRAAGLPEAALADAGEGA